MWVQLHLACRLLEGSHLVFRTRLLIQLLEHQKQKTGMEIGRKGNGIKEEAKRFTHLDEVL